jgi:hypothetical protein
MHADAAPRGVRPLRRGALAGYSTLSVIDWNMMGAIAGPTVKSV